MTGTNSPYISEAPQIAYPDLYYSRFGENVDNQFPMRDPTVQELAFCKQYDSLIASGNIAAANEVLLKNPSIKDCIINAEKLLRLQHSIIAVERFFFDNVQEKIYRIGNKKGKWNAQMSTETTGENCIKKFDVVSYPVSGIEQLFLAYNPVIPAGTLPTDASFYIQLTIRGEKGDTGTDGIDGVDGASGLGLSPRGAWVNNKEYFQYDLVSHSGYLWYALEDNTADEPKSTSVIWVQIDIALQVSYGTETPFYLSEGGVWNHLQDDGRIIMKTKLNDGSFQPFYPETKADYVKFANGENLQTFISKQTFDRDDVITNVSESSNVTTMMAKLKGNTGIIVGKQIVTDSLKINNMFKTETTIYDNTGIYVVYKGTTIITRMDDGSYESITELTI